MSTKLDELLANGNSKEYTPFDPHGVQENGPGVSVYVTGTFGGGSLQPQACPPFDTDDAKTFVNVGTAITTAGHQFIQLRCDRMRFVLTGATAPDIKIFCLG